MRQIEELKEKGKATYVLYTSIQEKGAQIRISSSTDYVYTVAFANQN